jgi:hypothetical protein
MEQELARMAEADRNARLRIKDRKKKEVAKVMAELHERKKKTGVTMTQDVGQARTAVRTSVREEERMALDKVRLP